MKNNLSLPRLLFCLFLLLNSTAFAQQNQPNIIFILTDDQRWDALGFSGNEIIQTPEMDRLAEQGVYFKNAFVTTPICAASRASILTGLYERTHGYTFGQTLQEPYAAESYPMQLKKGGMKRLYSESLELSIRVLSNFLIREKVMTGTGNSMIDEGISIRQSVRKRCI